MGPGEMGIYESWLKAKKLAGASPGELFWLVNAFDLRPEDQYIFLGSCMLRMRL
jgi:hypothetical protein